jgi:hypothetical protein
MWEPNLPQPSGPSWLVTGIAVPSFFTPQDKATGIKMKLKSLLCLYKKFLTVNKTTNQKSYVCTETKRNITFNLQGISITKLVI